MQTLDLGRRVDLLSMDPHFHDISIAVYRVDDSAGHDGAGGGAAYLLHSYSRRAGAGDRLRFLAGVMRTAGGMAAGGDPLTVRFACGHAHEAALKRLFTESCKEAPGAEPAPRPLSVHDRKNDMTIDVEALGGGRYRCRGDRDGARERRRVAAVAAGLGKLAELQVDGTEVRFPCGADHHELIGLLLIRALNVRGALREQEAAAARGMLTAPSQQR